MGGEVVVGWTDTEAATTRLLFKNGRTRWGRACLSIKNSLHEVVMPASWWIEAEREEDGGRRTATEEK